MKRCERSKGDGTSHL